MQVERRRPNRRQRRRERHRRVITQEQRNSKPSTDEFQVARWVKTCFQMKTTKYLNTQVQVFSSGNLIDRLLDTGFAMGSCPLFTNREETADFLHLMMAHDFFHHVKITQPTLQWHPDQSFIDDPGEFYAWTYEPLYLGNWSTLFLLYFSSSSYYIVHRWPESVKKDPRNAFLVASSLFVTYIIMTLSRLALFYIVRWITNQNYEFMILPNLCKILPFRKSIWPLCHIKYVGRHNTSKFNYSIFHIFDFYRVSVGTFIILVVSQILLAVYIFYIFFNY